MDRIEAADYHDLVRVSSPRVAPGGDRVAFVRTVPDGPKSEEATVYVVPVGGAEPRRFTLREGVDAEPRWSPSGDRLAFTSTRGAGDDRRQLWVLPADGGEARQVTDVAGGVSGIAWSPDGERIAFVQRASEDDRAADRDLAAPGDYEPEPPDPRVVDRTVWRADQRWFDGTRPQVYVADLDGDAVRRITDEPYDHHGPAWGDAGTLYYGAARGDPDPDASLEYDVVAHDLETGETETLHATTGPRTGLAATADGRVAYPYTHPERSAFRATEPRVLDAATGAVARPAAGLDRTLDDDTALQWGPDGETLYFATPDEGAVALWAVEPDGFDGGADRDGGRDGESEAGPGTTPGGGDLADDTTGETEGGPRRIVREEWAGLTGAHVGEDLVAFVRSEWDHPGDVFVASRGGAEGRRLTRVNAGYLDGRAVSRPEELAVEGDDGPVQAWVLTPPDFDPAETYPVVTEVHGGPHAMWTASGTTWHEFQTLAARGYVVVWSNPRGSTGYGEAHRRAIEGDWGAVTAADVLAVVGAVTDRPYADGESVFLTGGSFGGFATGWLVGRTDRFRAAVAQRGVYDLTGFYGSADGAYLLVEEEFDTTPTEGADRLWAQSPAAHADAVEAPTLVVHADDDYRVPPNTAELFYRLLRTSGVPTRMVRYPDEGHELSRSGEPGHVVDRIERIARWFDGYSPHHDAPPALERPDGAGLTAGEDADAAARDGTAAADADPDQE